MNDIFSNNKVGERSFLKNKAELAGEASVTKSTCYSSRGYEFSSQHHVRQLITSQPSVTPAPEHWTPLISKGTCAHVHIHTHKQRNTST